MLSLAQGRELIRTHVALLDPVPCALAEAHGRVLREEVRAREDFPAFDRSAMDGYAIARDDIYMREGVWVGVRVKKFGRVVRTGA